MSGWVQKLTTDLVTRMTARWELKLVALVTAIALWLYTGSQSRVERIVAVRISESSVVGVPDDWQITELTPREFNVTVNVPVARSDAAPEFLSPRLELRPDATKDGKQSFDLTRRLLGLGGDVLIVHTDPQGIRAIDVRLDQVVATELPIETPQVLVGTGVEATVQVDLTVVGGRGARGGFVPARAAHTRVRFAPVDLAGQVDDVAGERVERVTLTPILAPYRVVNPVVATITLRSIPAVKRGVPLPVRILGAREVLGAFDVELSPPQVTVDLGGPENLLKTLSPESDLTAYVRLPADLEPNTPRELPVQLFAPTWLTVDAPRVRVTLKAKSPGQ